MILSIVQCRAESDHRISCENAVKHRFPDSLFNGGDEFLRDCSADNCVDELEIFSGERLESHLNDTELAGAAGLLLVLAFRFGCSADGLAVSDPGSLQADFNSELGFELAYHDFEVLLAEAGDDLLAGLAVDVI